MMPIIRVLLIVAAILALGAPAYASNCPNLIRQANEQLAKLDQGSDKAKQAKALVGEADQLHKAGKHADSVQKAEEALAVLK